MVYFKSMIIGEIFTAEVVSLAETGAGVLRFEGQAVFVEKTAPGDTIAARVTEVHRSWAKADLLEIPVPSPDRTVPLCPAHDLCGGCSWQHIAYPAQLREKRNILAQALSRIGGLTVLPDIGVYPSQPYGYRARVQFHRVSPKEPHAVGFKARGSAEIIPIPDCPIADDGIRRALREQGIQFPPEKDRSTVFSWKNLFLNESKIQQGTVSIADRELRIDAGVFFQSNPALLEQVIPLVLAFSADADPQRGADIYSGVGTFGVFLKDRFQRLTVVEENKTALSLARENLRGASADFAALRADQWVKTLDSGGSGAGTQKAGADYGFIMADPPRQGLSPGFRAWLIRRGAPYFAYLSCDASAFARDAGALVRGGYTLETVRLFDFYPQTPHIETLGFFRKGANHV